MNGVELWGDIHDNDCIDQLRFTHGKIHYCLSAHAVTQEYHIFKVVLVDVPLKIGCHSVVVVLIVVWAPTVITAIYSVNLPALSCKEFGMCRPIITHPEESV